MPLIPRTYFKIGPVVFYSVETFHIQRRNRELMDRCTITLPLMRNWVNLGLSKYIKRNEQVTVKVRYEGGRELQEFQGWVRRSTPSSPMVVVCDNVPPIMRKNRIQKKWNSRVSLLHVLETILEGTGVSLERKNLPSWNFTSLRLNGTREQVLIKLGQEYGLRLRLNGNKLEAGLLYGGSNGPVRKYDLSTNVTGHNLTYRTKEEREIYVVATGWTRQGGKIETIVGNRLGERRSLQLYNVDSEKVLTERATQEWETFSYEGYEGNFTGFLYPKTEPGDTVELTDPLLVAKAGAYFCESADLKGGAKTGIQRICEIGKKLYNLPDPANISTIINVTQALEGLNL